ncbi:MAG: Crp/Fnr family transcriptional regulator [Armatimonadetes bacterium]|nr:Crp/Fnr family transcriptional regulator [Armatimonadota bacterium]
MSDRLAFLQSVPILADMPIEEIAQLESQVTERKYKPGVEVFSEGSEAFAIGVILRGRAKVVKHSALGRDITVAILKPGDIFGEVCLFLVDRIYTSSVVAITPMTALFIPHSQVVKTIDQSPLFAKRLIAAVSRRLCYTQEMLRFLVTEAVDKRIAHLLIYLAKITGVQSNDRALITTPLTRHEIADMAGTTVETTIRVLSRLTKAGYICTIHGKLVPKGCRLCGIDSYCHRCNKIVIMHLNALKSFVDESCDSDQPLCPLPSIV